MVIFLVFYGDSEMIKETKNFKSNSFDEINRDVKAFIQSRPGEEWVFTITANFPKTKSPNLRTHYTAVAERKDFIVNKGVWNDG